MLNINRQHTTSSNCKGKQRRGVILKMQELSKKAGLPNKKACLAFP